MEWYYAVKEEKSGPVSEVEFRRLVDEGVISGDTLVWNSGMTDWKPRSEVYRGGNAVGSICAECGQTFEPGEVIKLGSRYACAGCKPIVVQRMQEGGSDSDDESVRNQYLKHEASVRSIGLLYYLSGAGLLIASIGAGMAGFLRPESGGASSILISVVAALLLILLAVLTIWTGRNLRRLSPSARTPVGLLSGIGLLGFPGGTIINAYILYLVFSKQ